ncbi:hypothetical protein KAW18_03750 [candidate division WOR-3 bacterium]|nr:hypothetical protein [candidate division WOR-3 bacterium]
MKLDKNSMLCVKDLTHDHFWKGGNSWGIDSCPECGGMETILYKNLSRFQQIVAEIKFNKMWKNEIKKI